MEYAWLPRIFAVAELEPSTATERGALFRSATVGNTFGRPLKSLVKRRASADAAADSALKVMFPPACSPKVVDAVALAIMRTKNPRKTAALAVALASSVRGMLLAIDAVAVAVASKV